MPIKNIQLKNGNKYPLGAAYREPAASGGQTGYTASYDSEATGTGTLTLEISASGNTLQEETYTIFPFTSHPFTTTEMSTVKAKVGVTPLVSLFGLTSISRDVEDFVVTDVDTLLTLLLATQNVTLTSQFSSTLPGIAGSATVHNEALSFLSFSDAVDTSATATGATSIGGDTVSVDITASIVVPTGGTYWTLATDNVSNLNPTLDIAIGSWEFDSRYVGQKLLTINNRMITDVAMMYNGTFDLTMCPSLEKKLKESFVNRVPIVFACENSLSSPLNFCYCVLNLLTYNTSTNVAKWSSDVAILEYDYSQHTLTFSRPS